MLDLCLSTCSCKSWLYVATLCHHYLFLGFICFMNKLKFIVSFIKRRWCKKKKKLTTSMMHQLPFFFLILKLVVAIWNLLFIACNFKRKWATQNLRLFMFSILQEVDICFMYIVFYTHKTLRWIIMVNVYLFIYHLTIAPNNVKSCTSSSRALNSSHENLE